MASTLTFFAPSSTTLRASARKPDPKHKKPGSPAWWAPLFNMSSEPDYIITNITSGSQNQYEMQGLKTSTDRPMSRFNPGCFTEEKAKKLRKKTVESSSFHDIMYHSAIASRLASDVESFEDM